METKISISKASSACHVAQGIILLFLIVYVTFLHIQIAQYLTCASLPHNYSNGSAVLRRTARHATRQFHMQSYRDDAPYDANEMLVDEMALRTVAERNTLKTPNARRRQERMDKHYRQTPKTWIEFPTMFKVPQRTMLSFCKHVLFTCKEKNTEYVKTLRGQQGPPGPRGPPGQCACVGVNTPQYEVNIAEPIKGAKTLGDDDDNARYDLDNATDSLIVQESSTVPFNQDPINSTNNSSTGAIEVNISIPALILLSTFCFSENSFN